VSIWYQVEIVRLIQAHEETRCVAEKAEAEIGAEKRARRGAEKDKRKALEAVREMRNTVALKESAVQSKEKEVR